MIYEENTNNKRVMFKTFEYENTFLENGNLRIDYIKEKKIYIVHKKDKTTFDGTEKIERIYFGKEEETLETVLEYLVEALTLVQFIPETFMFNEFYYRMSADKKSIVIMPKFYENELNTTLILDDESLIVHGFALRKKMKAIKKQS